MMKIRYVFAVLGMLLYPGVSSAQVSISIGLPHVSIGINLPVFPQLVVVPGYPVYYAPRLEANYFFYDGMYWVYQDDNWYSSSWYNGPWWLVVPEVVPVYILRIPVRYYRRPPVYFHAWRPEAPPRWSHHWGHDWEQRRSGWDKWDHHAVPPPAPLPVYQRQYSRDRYPRQVERQQQLHQQKYRYQPRDPVVRQRYQEQAAPKSPARQQQPHRERQGAPEEQGSRTRDHQRAAPRPQEGPAVPRAQSPQRGEKDVQNRKQPPELDEHGRKTPRSQSRKEQQDRDAVHERKRRPGQEHGRDRDEKN